MTGKVPCVVLEPRRIDCSSQIDWDSDSLILSCALSCSQEVGSLEPDLAKKIDQYFDIQHDHYRIILGEMDIILDPKQRMESLEIRTNPINWESSSLQSLPNELDSIFIYFPADYDLNHIASFDVPTRIVQDMPKQQLGFLFGDYVSSKWVWVADHLVVGLTLDNYLSELRLANLDFSLFRA